MIDVAASLSRWIQQVIGKYINMDWNPTNRGFGAQCWDLAANWSTFLGLPVINTGGKGRWPGWAGNMVDAFPQTAEIAAAYELVGPDQGGLPGDIAVWGDSNPSWYPSTHVAVLVLDKGAWLQVMSQNSIPAQPDNPYPGDSTGPTTLQSLPRKGLIGFIRPRIGGIAAQAGPIAPLIQEDELSAAEVDRLINETQAQADVTRQFLADRVKEAALAILNGSQAQQDVTRDYLANTTQAQSDVTRAYLKDRIKESSPADLAGQINAAGIASEVRDELVKLIGGK